MTDIVAKLDELAQKAAPPPLFDLSRQADSEFALALANNWESISAELKAAREVCELEEKWQRHELGDDPPESIQPALVRWRQLRGKS